MSVCVRMRSSSSAARGSELSWYVRVPVTGRDIVIKKQHSDGSVVSGVRRSATYVLESRVWLNERSE